MSEMIPAETVRARLARLVEANKPRCDRCSSVAVLRVDVTEPGLGRAEVPGVRYACDAHVDEVLDAIVAAYGVHIAGKPQWLDR